MAGLHVRLLDALQRAANTDARLLVGRDDTLQAVLVRVISQQHYRIDDSAANGA